MDSKDKIYKVQKIIRLKAQSSVMQLFEDQDLIIQMEEAGAVGLDK